MCECVCDGEELMRRYVVYGSVCLEKVGFCSANSMERYSHLWLAVSYLHEYGHVSRSECSTKSQYKDC